MLNYLTYFAAVNANCDIQKLINTLTASPSQTFSTASGRIAGGMMFEIPEDYAYMTTTTDCFTFMLWSAKLFALVFDYHI